MAKYKFEVEKVFNIMKADLLAFLEKVGTKKVVLGMSGGKDSTVVAAFCAKVLGPENVIGVMMPNGMQKDIADARQAIADAGIVSYAIDIRNAFDGIVDQLHYNGLKESADTMVNLPPRLRMSTLFAVAQTVGAVVLNTDNKLEIDFGYYTIFGDGAGSYGPIRDLTVPEVLELGKFLGVKDNLLFKKPGDGLQALGDEDRLGFTYSDAHRLARLNEGTAELIEKTRARYLANKFKTEIVNIPCPKFGFPDYIVGENID